jgi:hypothetical protein
VKLPSILAQFLSWLRETLAVEVSTDARPARTHFLAMCVCVFLIALGVRLLYWQDNRVEIERGKTLATGLAKHYEGEAQRMIDEGRVLFPRDFVDAGDVRLIIHPPGYSILMAAVLRAVDNSTNPLILFQIIGDALAAVLVLMIALELLPVAAAMIGALLAALFPHSSYYSVWLSPDTLAVLPILLAVYFIVRLSKRPKLATAVVSGAMIGLSCWLRANALLLAPFLAITIFVLVVRGRRLRCSIAFIAAALAVISPITIRNAILYRHFIPLSVGSGITLIEGIADYDRNGRFGMPQTDRDAANKDVEWNGREDYAGNLWSPDGIERDRARFARGFSVIRDNPGWFFSVMMQRAGFMLSYDKPYPPDWPFNTVSVPTVSAEPSVGHDASLSIEAPPVAEITPGEVIANGNLESRSAAVSLDQDAGSLQVTGDDSAFGDQFSVPIAVNKNTDYLIAVVSTLVGGRAALKVTSTDHRIALASTILNAESNEGTRRERKRNRMTTDDQPLNPRPALELAFATGDRTEVRLVVSNNGAADERPIVKLGQVRVFELGATPYLWSRYPRSVIRGAQKNLFTTMRLIPCVLMGILLLALAKRWRALAMLLVVPLYYLCVQSALHTEYRYILAIHYFLFIFAGATLYCAGRLVWGGTRSIASYVRRVSAKRFAA